MPDVGKLEITLPSDREIAMTRVFDAPRHLVFEAYTRPALLTRWLGVRAGWQLAVCEIDLRVGGSYRYVWRKDDGFEMGMGGVYREIVPPARIVATEKFDQSWYEGDAVVTVTLVESAGRTTFTLAVQYQSKEVRDGVLKTPMKSGVKEGFNKLAELLPGMAKEIK
jgi:uncharacterized protein YndB with AHSA1/START domain